MTHSDYIDSLKSEWIGSNVIYGSSIYKVVDVDHNGFLLIDKKGQYTDTTAVSTSDVHSVPAEKNASLVEWIPVTKSCPEEKCGRWLVTLKSGLVTIASYRADTDGDYWTGLDFGRQDCYFAIDPVIAWSPMPKGYISE